jgi:hypothetical protein
MAAYQPLESSALQGTKEQQVILKGQEMFYQIHSQDYHVRRGACYPPTRGKDLIWQSEIRKGLAYLMTPHGRDLLVAETLIQ